jgi:alkylhydroperoxidase family enzyme
VDVAGDERLLARRAGREWCACEARSRRRSSMRIEPVEREQAPPVVQRIYDAIEKSTGRVSPFFKMLGNKPELLRAFNQLYGVVWAEGALAARLKELAYLRVSILNGCGY